MTFEDTRNAISSQEAGCGPLQGDLLDGLTTSHGGPDRVRVNRSARLEKVVGSMIQGTCGRTYFDSSVPVGPLSSWESRLRERLAMVGSTESALIWREKTTPQGQLISRLAPSMRHTNGTDCIWSLWTTVSARDWKDSAGMAIEAKDGRVRLDQLPRQMISYSPTPRASDGEKGGPNMSFGAGGTPLPALMYSYNHFETSHGGQTPTGSSAPSTEKRGAPNPALPFWLMGFPDEWICGAYAAMQYHRSSRRKSSPRISKRK